MMKLNIKARLQYGRSFLYEAISHVFAFYLLDFLAIWVILSKFSSIGGWSFFEVLFLQTYGYFIRGISAAVFWDAMINMSDLVREGTIDRFLVAPVNTFYYIVSSKFGVWTFSHIAVGAAGICITASFLNIHWVFSDVIYLILGFISGFCVYSALIIIGGALSFWVVKSKSFLWILLDSMSLTNYPITIYPAFLQIILLFVFPIALVNYYPAAFVLGKTSTSFWLMIVIVIASCLFLALSYKLWCFGARKYQGTGN